MSDTNKQDSAGVPVETGEAPLPPVSQPSTGQLGSTPSIESDALYKKAVEDAKASLRDEFKRELAEAKSTKDRAINNVTEQLKRYDQLLEHYKDPDEAKWRLSVESQLQERSSPVDTGSVTRAGLEGRARDKLGKLGVTEKADQDAIMQEWASKNVPAGGYGSDDAALVGIAEFVVDYKVAKAKRDAPASAAAAIAPKGGERAPEDIESLGSQLAELQKGNVSDPANIAARAALSERLKKARSSK